MFTNMRDKKFSLKVILWKFDLRSKFVWNWFDSLRLYLMKKGSNNSPGFS